MLTKSGKKVQIFLFTGLKPRQIHFWQVKIATRIRQFDKLTDRKYKWSLSSVEMYQSCRMKYKTEACFHCVHSMFSCENISFVLRTHRCSFDVSLRKHFGRSLRELPPQLTHRLSFSTFIVITIFFIETTDFPFYIFPFLKK